MIATTTRILSFVLAASLLATPRALAADSGDAAYVALAQTYYTGVFKLNPTYATNVGVHDYDDQLGDYSAAGVDKQIAYDRDYLAKVTAIDPATLSPSVALDRTLLENRLHDRILLADTLGVWKHSPDYYTRAASGAVFSIMSKDYAPLTTRIVYAAAREEAIPAMLQDAEKNITSVDAVTQRIAAADAAGSVSFFKNSVPLAFTDVHDAALQSRLQSANAGAMSAMSAYAAWIKALKPSGTYAIGADAYKARLLYEDALDIPLDQYLAVGERALAQTRAEFIEAARKIDPNATPQQVYLTITKAQPPPDSLLATAERDLARLRAFVEAKHIVSLPANANIKVIDTPPFERLTITAAEDSPGPLETVATQAYYYVTPVDPAWPQHQKDGFLAQFNNYGFPIISAHEVYPGHFTNFSIERGLDLSLTRKLSTTSEFAEGWAHYSEQMMVEQGWGNGDPRVHMAQLQLALLRECRYIAGMKLHTQGMTLEQAEQLFTGQCFLTPAVAEEESLRGTQDPMYGYYTLGKLMILKLRADFKKKLGSAYTLEKFHDELLSRGDPPIPLLRPFILGSSDDGKPL